MPAPVSRSAAVQVAVRARDAATLDRKAQATGLSRSELIREAIVKGLQAEGVRAVTQVARRRDPRDCLNRLIAAKVTARDLVLVEKSRRGRTTAETVRAAVLAELAKPSRQPSRPDSGDLVGRVSVPLADSTLAQIQERLRGRPIAPFVRECIRQQLGDLDG